MLFPTTTEKLSNQLADINLEEDAVAGVSIAHQEYYFSTG